MVVDTSWAGGSALRWYKVRIDHGDGKIPRYEVVSFSQAEISLPEDKVER